MPGTRGAAAMAVGWVMLVAGCGQSTITSSVHASPSAEANSSSALPSTSPSAPAGTTEWAQVASFDEHVSGLVYGPDGYLAIGWGGPAAENPAGATGGRIWLSSDGSQWELLPPDEVFARAQLSDVVVARDGGYLVFGTIGSRSEEDPDLVAFAIWESPDGRSWTRTQLGLPTELDSFQVVAGEKGYLLAANRLTGDVWEWVLWLSADARDWEVVREVAQFETGGDSVYLQGVAAGQEGFVVTSIAAAQTNDQALDIVASGDGREWFDSAPILGVGPGTEIAPLAGDWIIASPVKQSLIPIWFSANGLDWKQLTTLDTDSASNPQLGPLVGTGDRVFVQLWDYRSDQWLAAGVRSSSDGIVWEDIDAASSVFLAGAASSGDTIVVAGDRPDGAVFIVRSVGASDARERLN